MTTTRRVARIWNHPIGVLMRRYGYLGASPSGTNGFHRNHDQTHIAWSILARGVKSEKETAGNKVLWLSLAEKLMAKSSAAGVQKASFSIRTPLFSEASHRMGLRGKRSNMKTSRRTKRI